ncbi:MAG: ATP-binding cassette domain-containing protein [Rhodospirillales bacterium]|nr:ATP-binding cassette domain-containing protein [Alphaproteobacteria bacterium]MBL6928077.1 ATP-binding cassette domain-containing protein [Rhodospirillales bacterium]
MTDKKPALAVQGIYKRFGELEVLKGIDLWAKEHDVISIIGASGSGKSTFLRCINLLEVPDAGRVEVDGELIEMHTLKDGRYVPANQKQVDRIRASVGMVFQNFNLWAHMTILENVIEAPVHVLKMPKDAAIAKGEALLEKVGIADKRHHYPSQLSGGQQQRCAIARTLAMDPKLLLFDEATSALDPELVGEVLKVIRDLAEEGRTMIMVTHEMGFAREVSDEIVFLHKGKVEEQGPPSLVFENPKSERCRQFLASTL